MAKLNDPTSPFHGFEIISTCTAEQAVEDGVLIPVPFEPHSFVTASVAGELRDVLRNVGLAEMYDDTLRALWEAVKQPANLQDGWYVVERQGLRFWMIPNEVGGWTLMFPEDY